jgi:modulator of FtsH protease
MSDNISTLNDNAFGTVVTTSAAERNRVLRNTYVLLAVSLLPTVLGAYLGVSTGLSKVFSGWMGLIVMLAGAFGFIYAIEKTKNSSKGVYVLLGFTFFMGLVLSSLIARVLGFRNGASLVMTAFGGTAGVFFVMATLATMIKRDLSGMGKWLFWGAMVLMIGSIINIFVGSTMGMAAMSTLHQRNAGYLSRPHQYLPKLAQLAWYLWW